MSNAWESEFERLLTRVLDSRAEPADLLRLDNLLAENPAAMTAYVSLMQVDAMLRWRSGLGTPKEGQWTDAGSEAREDDARPGAERLSAAVKSAAAESPAPSPEPLIPPIVFDSSSTVQQSLGLFAPGSWLFSYAAATVITGAMLLIFSVWKVSHEHELAKSPLASTTPAVEREKSTESVGRITGTADCRWADPQNPLPAVVSLGRKYELASGLVEISYDSGAKVVLQGPCTYEVDSASGGFLSLGKLTARVESATPQAANPKSEVPNPKFVVKTPTAVVTDLGTEFGVEVSPGGTTTSHVFRGLVRVALAGGSGANGTHDVVLRENESARVEAGDAGGGPRLAPQSAVANVPHFARRLTATPKILDLLDIVAGGDGTGHRRERGIDPTTGMEDPVFRASERGGDRQYRPIAWHKPIDGVFVPDGGAGPVVLDSAGHTFDGFPKTSGVVFGSIWARAADVSPQYREYYGASDAQHWIFAIGRPQQFMPERRGLLGFCANVGMTFNLEALRKMHRETRPARFRAVAGLADARPIDPGADGMADIWVLVDGRLKLKRTHLRPQDGTVNVDVELGPSDRFLTLVSTDGGNGIGYDWVVFGDPVLQMASTESENSAEEHP